MRLLSVQPSPASFHFLHLKSKYYVQIDGSKKTSSVKLTPIFSMLLFQLFRSSMGLSMTILKLKENKLHLVRCHMLKWWDLKWL
jgi:hypothetical protein